MDTVIKDGERLLQESAFLTSAKKQEKGNELAQATYKLLKKTKIKSTSSATSKEKKFSGLCDVVVCDGFVGNVALKITEGTAGMMFRMLKQEFKTDPLAKIAGLIAKPFMQRIYKKINHEEFGGALLLGVKGITVIAHGSSKAYAVKNAVRVAKEAVETQVNNKIAEFWKATEKGLNPKFQNVIKV